VQALEKALLGRVSQGVLPCPTTRCFSIRHDQCEAQPYYRLGRKVAYFGDRFEKLEQRFERRMWVVPTMAGEFCIDRRFPYHDGVMGGNLWFMGTTEEAALLAAERAVDGLLSNVVFREIRSGDDFGLNCSDL
jgi:formylmethanofuran--tetrahydromethanopterin N-formyltransferase